MSLQRQMISGCPQFNTTAITSANLFKFQTWGWCQLETDSKSKHSGLFLPNQIEQILDLSKPKDGSLHANHLEVLHSQIWQRSQTIFKNQKGIQKNLLPAAGLQTVTPVPVHSQTQAEERSQQVEENPQAMECHSRPVEP